MEGRPRAAKYGAECALLEEARGRSHLNLNHPLNRNLIHPTLLAEAALEGPGQVHEEVEADEGPGQGQSPASGQAYWESPKPLRAEAEEDGGEGQWVWKARASMHMAEERGMASSKRMTGMRELKVR